MNTQTQEALEQAEFEKEFDRSNKLGLVNEQPAPEARQEPKAWLVEGIDAYIDYAKAVITAQANAREIRNLYTHHTKEWIGLSDEEINALKLLQVSEAVIRAIEQFLKEKNT